LVSRAKVLIRDPLLEKALTGVDAADGALVNRVNARAFKPMLCEAAASGLDLAMIILRGLFSGLWHFSLGGRQ
jgi:hypothetical protein